MGKGSDLNPANYPKGHGRKPSPPPSQAGKKSCFLELAVAVPMTLFYALPRLAYDTYRERRR